LEVNIFICEEGSRLRRAEQSLVTFGDLAQTHMHCGDKSGKVLQLLGMRVAHHELAS
jgi:hypothetical protein